MMLFAYVLAIANWCEMTSHKAISVDKKILDSFVGLVSYGKLIQMVIPLKIFKKILGNTFIIVIHAMREHFMLNDKFKNDNATLERLIVMAINLFIVETIFSMGLRTIEVADKALLLFLVASSNSLAENNGDYRQRCVIPSSSTEWIRTSFRINNSLTLKNLLLGNYFFLKLHHYNL